MLGETEVLLERPGFWLTTVGPLPKKPTQSFISSIAIIRTLGGLFGSGVQLERDELVVVVVLGLLMVVVVVVVVLGVGDLVG